jgi:hypothetical protein
MRSAGGSEFDSEIQFALALLDSANVSRADIVSFAKKCKVTGSNKFPDTSATPGNKSFVASVYPLDRAIAEIICNICGGRGHKGWQCATAKLRTAKADDGTSKPIANVDRELTFRDSAGGRGSGAGRGRGTGRLKSGTGMKRRLSADEWA